MTEPRPRLCVLFLHHKDDALTRHHYDLLCRSNPHATIVPLVDAPESALPGAVDVSRFPSRWDTRNKWRNCDTMVYRWFENRPFDADQYVYLEYDCRCDVDLEAFFRPYAWADVVVSRWLLPGTNARWYWWPEADKLGSEDRPFVAGAVPMACARMSHEALERICRLATSADVISEMRFGTAVQRAGLRVAELSGERKRRVSAFEYAWPIVGPGLYHPIKSLAHNRTRPAAAVRRGALFVRRQIGKALVAAGLWEGRPQR